VTAASFVLDENVASAVANGLRRVVVEAVTLVEIGRLGLPDPDQLQWAFEQGRVVVTHDEDYVSLAYSRAVHAGVGYCHQEKYRGRPGALIRRILQLHAETEAEEWANRVVFL
jgi:predicted nuclease of predicted toxin-antitoxin system